MFLPENVLVNNVYSDFPVFFPEKSHRFLFPTFPQMTIIETGHTKCPTNVFAKKVHLIFITFRFSKDIFLRSLSNGRFTLDFPLAIFVIFFSCKKEIVKIQILEKRPWILTKTQFLVLTWISWKFAQYHGINLTILSINTIILSPNKHRLQLNGIIFNQN